MSTNQRRPSKDKTLTSVVETKQYEKFKFIPSNRPVERRHVEDLKQRMGKKYQLAPIMVSRKMEILDGQHRFTAARELGLPIRYYIASDGEVADMAELNNAAKGWKSKDYAHHFSVQGNDHYRKYIQFAERFPKFSFSVAISLLTGGKRSAPNETDFPLGKFKVKQFEKAVEMAEFFTELSPLYKGWARRAFILSVLRMMKHPEWNSTRFMRKMKFKGQSIPDFSTEEEYMKHLEMVYNWSEQHKISFFGL